MFGHFFFFFFASASMRAHRYASRDNSRGLVKNYDRGIKTKPSERPGAEPRLVLSVLRQMPAKPPSRGTELARGRGEDVEGAAWSLSVTPPAAFCLQTILSPHLSSISPFQEVISTAAYKSPLPW